jgi:hypothetical protein
MSKRSATLRIYRPHLRLGAIPHLTNISPALWPMTGQYTALPLHPLLFGYELPFTKKITYYNKPQDDNDPQT